MKKFLIVFLLVTFCYPISGYCLDQIQTIIVNATGEDIKLSKNLKMLSPGEQEKIYNDDFITYWKRYDLNPKYFDAYNPYTIVVRCIWNSTNKKYDVEVSSLHNGGWADAVTRRFSIVRGQKGYLSPDSSVFCSRVTIYSGNNIKVEAGFN